MNSMISREIQCTYCGWKGMTGRSNKKTHNPDEQAFKYLGHNFLSGHLHYQCPDCSVVFLVPPMDIMKDDFGTGIPHASLPKNENLIGERYGLTACL
jgi:DNA-directed RNA polymerase subunit RPC12/RpoP